MARNSHGVILTFISALSSRRRRLLDMGLGDETKDEDGQPSNLCQTFEKKRAEHLEHLQSKEDEMRQLFVQRFDIIR